MELHIQRPTIRRYGINPMKLRKSLFEKKNSGKVSMGVVRTTYLIDENGIIAKVFGKVNAAENPAQMLEEI